MQDFLKIKNGISIPLSELEFTFSRSGGPGGQHVNKSSTKVTVRWNVKNTVALNEEQKIRILNKLGSKISKEGDLIVHESSYRSQLQNKDAVLKKLAQEIKAGLYVSKKRMKTSLPKSAKEERLKFKSKKSQIKKLRSKKSFEE